MTIQDSKVVRRYITDAIANSHSAIKSCWLIMFTAGTYASLSTINSVLRCYGYLSGSVAAGCTQYHYPMSFYAFAFVIFFLTFARFYVGDVRIFDRRYSEIFKVINEEVDTKGDVVALRHFETLLSFSDNHWYKLEVIWLLFQTLLIVFTSLQIDQPVNYIITYAILLVLNSSWLALMNVKTEPTANSLIEEIFPFSAPARPSSFFAKRWASWKWVGNNLTHAIVLIPLAYYVTVLHSTNLLFLGLLVCFSNCMFDFALTHDFYFPKFRKFYADFVAQDQRDEVAVSD